MTVLIFANGDIDDGYEWIRPYLPAATAVIAANGGTRHLHALRWLPDLVIGDQDSLSADLNAWLKANDVPRQRHPSAKNETDLELALIYAVGRYDAEVMLFGLLGGRLDQTIANIMLLSLPALGRHQVTLVTAHERAWLVRESTVVSGAIGDIVSLIPLGGDVIVAGTSGLQWPLPGERLQFGLARGVSNVLTAQRATVQIDSGLLLCVHTEQ